MKEYGKNRNLIKITGKNAVKDSRDFEREMTETCIIKQEILDKDKNITEK